MEFLYAIGVLSFAMVLCAWLLHRRETVKLRIDDIEAEGRTVDEVERLLHISTKFQLAEYETDDQSSKT